MSDPLETWSLDREIVLVRVLNHPRDKVFAAWTDPAALSVWYGPAGLSIETHEADIREGGIWRFDMVGTFEGKAQRFPNLIRFLKIVPNERLVWAFRFPDGPEGQAITTVTFHPQGQQTHLKVEQAFFNLEGIAAQAIEGAPQGWGESLDKLGEFLAERRGA